MPTSSLLDAALHYVELGYRVFPCVPGGKTPLTQHGFHDATCDPEKIESWWAKNPDANVAIATEGLLVVDIDGNANPWPGDPERGADLTRTGALSLTPRGGRHYFFRKPAGKPWRCTESRLGPKVDTRTDGGYVLVPPSQVDGRAYRWAPEGELEDPPERLPEPPAWLVQELDRLSIIQPVVATTADGGPIPEGQRNSALARLAGTMRRVGMTRNEIAAALLQVNQDRCVPPLPTYEVEQIASSISKYTPDQIATAMVEGRCDYLIQPQLTPVSLVDLLASHPNLRPPVVHGLLRQGETMNIVSPPKVGKSWLVLDLALSAASGRPWLDTFETDPGDVLILDNELHGETLANRIPKVAAARGIDLTVVGQRVFVQTLRGSLMDFFSLESYFRALEPKKFKLVVLDAMYRFMPRGGDENDNGTITGVYNAIDRYADLLGCSFVLIHHTSKGNQSGKALTDVGAGAGSQSRATDTHLILRPHEEDDAVVLEAAVRSWPPVLPRCLRWTFPVWTPADDLDPTKLRSERPRKAHRGEEAKEVKEAKPEVTWDEKRFAAAFITSTPKTRDAILSEANAAGLSDWKAERLLRRAEALGLVYRWGNGRNRPSTYASIPQPASDL